MPSPGRSDIAKQDALRERQQAAQTAKAEPTELADVVSAVEDVTAAIEALGTLLGGKLDAIEGKLDDAITKLDAIATNTGNPIPVSVVP